MKRGRTYVRLIAKGQYHTVFEPSYEWHFPCCPKWRSHWIRATNMPVCPWHAVTP